MEGIYVYHCVFYEMYYIYVQILLKKLKPL